MDEFVVQENVVGDTLQSPQVARQIAPSELVTAPAQLPALAGETLNRAFHRKQLRLKASLYKSRIYYSITTRLPSTLRQLPRNPYKCQCPPLSGRSEKVGEKDHERESFSRGVQQVTKEASPRENQTHRHHQRLARGGEAHAYDE